MNMQARHRIQYQAADFADAALFADGVAAEYEGTARCGYESEESRQIAATVARRYRLLAVAARLAGEAV